MLFDGNARDLIVNNLTMTYGARYTFLFSVSNMCQRYG